MNHSGWIQTPTIILALRVTCPILEAIGVKDVTALHSLAEILLLARLRLGGKGRRVQRLIVTMYINHIPSAESKMASQFKCSFLKLSPRSHLLPLNPLTHSVLRFLHCVIFSYAKSPPLR